MYQQIGTTLKFYGKWYTKKTKYEFQFSKVFRSQRNNAMESGLTLHVVIPASIPGTSKGLPASSGVISEWSSSNKEYQQASNQNTDSREEFSFQNATCFRKTVQYFSVFRKDYFDLSTINCVIILSFWTESV